MKRFLIVFTGLILTAPAFADPIPQYVEPTHPSNQATATTAAAAPKYSFNEITSTDSTHIASTAYVKGAHNSALTAINYLGDNKVGTTKTDSGSGAVVTGITVSSSGVTVSKGEVTIPVGAASGNGVTSYANIWVE